MFYVTVEQVAVVLIDCCSSVIGRFKLRIIYEVFRLKMWCKMWCKMRYRRHFCERQQWEGRMQSSN